MKNFLGYTKDYVLLKQLFEQPVPIGFEEVIL